jgi:hypothetical protein
MAVAMLAYLKEYTNSQSIQKTLSIVKTLTAAIINANSLEKINMHLSIIL